MAEDEEAVVLPNDKLGKTLTGAVDFLSRELPLTQSRRATQTCSPPAAKRRATAAPMASPAPTSRATGLLAVMCVSFVFLSV